MTGDFEDDFTIRVGTNATTCIGRVIDLTAQFFEATNENLSYSDKKVFAAFLKQLASRLDDETVPF